MFCPVPSSKRQQDLTLLFEKRRYLYISRSSELVCSSADDQGLVVYFSLCDSDDFFLSLLCSLLYARYITHPIVQLSQISKQMAELNFSGKCNEGRKDELGCLAQNLNSLSTALSTALTDLQMANQQLRTDMESIPLCHG